MKTLQYHREAINAIDDEILNLLNKRAEHVKSIGHIKKSEGLPIWAPERERAIYERLERNNLGGFPNAAVRNVFREIISASVALEKPIYVGYFGLAGTFSNLAAIKRFGNSAELLPLGDLREVFEWVEKGKVKYGVIPIENTIEGVVNHTLDMFIETPLFIVGEIVLEISQNLLNKTGNINDVKMVYSHPHAIAQCRNWLGKHLPLIPILACDSTAKAAEMAQEDGSIGAIASEMAETVYELRAIEKHIEDERLNFTRFIIIGKEPISATGRDTTSLMFAVKNEAGALCNVLEVLRKAGVNMTRLESRPSKQKVWEYTFYLNIDGHIDDEPIAKALKELAEKAANVKILGSYPKGDL